MIRRLGGPFVAVIMVAVAVSCSSPANAPQVRELQRAKSGSIEVVLLSAADAIKSGKDEAVLEFRTGTDRHLVDVGTVTMNASMVMAGMGPMLGTTALTRGDTPGRYTVATDLSMSGTWRLELSWDGPAGKGSVTLATTVR